MKKIPAHVPAHNISEIICALKDLSKKELKQNFEDKVKDFLKSEYYLSTWSGKQALYIGLKTLGIKKDDEIILPGYTSNVVPMVIKQLGAIPIPVDVNLDDYNIDAQKVQESITKKTKAIIAVHTFGYPCDMNELNDICKDKNIYLIEDAAQAFGAEYNGKKVGTIGDLGFFSFGFGKSISMGIGGGITTHHKDVWSKLQEIIIINKSSLKQSIMHFTKMVGTIFLSNPYLYGMIGYKAKKNMVLHQYSNLENELENARDLPKFAYAIGIQELKNMNSIIMDRRHNAFSYSKILQKKNIHYPKEKKGRYHVYTRYMVRFNTKKEKEDVIKKMLNLNIEPVLMQQGYPISVNFYPNNFKKVVVNSQKLRETCIGLPISTKLSQDILEQIFKNYEKNLC